MRISDWSSDVCSSDLRAGRQIKVHRILAHGHDNRETDEQTLDRRGLGRNARFCEAGRDVAFSSGTVVSGFAWRGVAAFAAGLDAPDGAYEDRESVESGKSVYVRVSLGGSRHIKKK